MKLSTRARYGLKAMVDLAERYGGGMVSTSALAALQGISDAYLEQLIAALRRAGLVVSVRGAQGGYALSRPPCGNQRGGCAAGVGRQHGGDGVRRHQPGLLRQRVLLQRPAPMAQAPAPH